MFYVYCFIILILKFLLNFGSKFVEHECHAGSFWVHYKRKIEPPPNTQPWYLDQSTASCRITEKPKGNKMYDKFICSKYKISIRTDCVSTFNTMINVQIGVPSQWGQTKISITVTCQTFGTTYKTLKKELGKTRKNIYKKNARCWKSTIKKEEQDNYINR